MSKLSERVLARKRARHARWAGRTARGVALAALVLTAWSAYRGQKKVDAPTWADFVPMTPGDTAHEYVKGTNGLGVPVEITVNGELWSLVLVNHFADVDMAARVVTDRRMAQTDCAHRTISYITTSDPRRLRVNLMHEVFHAGACLHGGAAWWNSAGDGDANHPGIYHLGEFTATFLHDNPAFAAWVAQ